MKKIFKPILILSLVAILSLSFNYSLVNENNFSSILANVEAMAQGEGGGGGGVETIRPNETKVFNDCKNPLIGRGCDPLKGAKCTISGGGCSIDVSTVLSALGLLVTILSMFC